MRVLRAAFYVPTKGRLRNMFTNLGDLVGTAGDESVDSFIATIAPVMAEAREESGNPLLDREFSIRMWHYFGGRLAISLVRNPDLAALRPKGASWLRFERMPDGLGFFITLSRGDRFLNIDWV
jgi:hypothetical protein